MMNSKMRSRKVHQQNSRLSLQSGQLNGKANNNNDCDKNRKSTQNQLRKLTSNQTGHLISKATQSGSKSHYICSGCSKPIKRDKYLLKVHEINQYWHENCLKCDHCHGRLGELGSSLFFKSNMNLCRQDYLELFGKTGFCSACEKLIGPSEMVMRAKNDLYNNVYHLECFACQLCNQRFCVGDRFYLYQNKVVCQYDYEEHILPIQRSIIQQESEFEKESSTTAQQTSTSINSISTISSTSNRSYLNNYSSSSSLTIKINQLESSLSEMETNNKKSLKVEMRENSQRINELEQLKAVERMQEIDGVGGNNNNNNESFNKQQELEVELAGEKGDDDELICSEFRTKQTAEMNKSETDNEDENKSQAEVTDDQNQIRSTC